MPTYLYECPIHGEFEHQHSITETLYLCPKCEEVRPPCKHATEYEQADCEFCRPEMSPPKVKRLISAGTGFILNGSGWAKDNYS